MERYARHVVYSDYTSRVMRPTASFDTLREAVRYADRLAEGGAQVKVIDLEHLDLGDMLTAKDCRELLARIRASVTA